MNNNSQFLKEKRGISNANINRVFVYNCIWKILSSSLFNYFKDHLLFLSLFTATSSILSPLLSLSLVFFFCKNLECAPQKTKRRGEKFNYYLFQKIYKENKNGGIHFFYFSN